MRTDFEHNEAEVRSFFTTMYERQLIWYKRFILKLPRDQWTSDAIFNKYRFTNVYRELDRASQWLLYNIILNTSTWLKYNNDYDNHINLIWKILLFRMINNPSIFINADAVPDYNDYDPNKFYDYVKKDILAKGIVFHHNAYCSNSKLKIQLDNDETVYFENIADYTIRHASTSLHDNIPRIYEIMQQSFSNTDPYALMTFMSTNIVSVGGFKAHEFYQDLCYIKPYANLELMACDANSATNAGNGSLSGTRMLFNNIHSRSDAVDAIYYLRDMSEDYLDKIHNELYQDTDGFYYVKWDSDTNQYIRDKFNFTLSQIEHWLCEYSKYKRYAIGDKKTHTRRYNDPKSSDGLIY